MQRLRSQEWPSRIDAGVALVLAAWALAEAGDPAVGIPAALLMTAPLAWRRHAPTATAGLVATGLVLQAAQPDPPESLATVVAFLLATFSVSAHAPSRRSVAVGLVLLLAAGVGETALAGDSDYAFITVLLAVAAAAGYAVRERDAARERDALLAVQAERERIARDLHDSVAHAVSLMVVQAGAAETVAAGDDPNVVDALRRVQDTGREAVADLGRVVGLLRAGDDDAGTPVLGNGRALVESFRNAGLPVELELTGDVTPLSAGIDTTAYRVVQEALTNALKHGAGDAQLTIDYGRDVLRLEIANAMPREPARSNGTGHGLLGMRERVRIYDGELTAGRRPDGAFVVEARLPLQPRR